MPSRRTNREAWAVYLEKPKIGVAIYGPFASSDDAAYWLAYVPPIEFPYVKGDTVGIAQITKPRMMVQPP